MGAQRPLRISRPLGSRSGRSPGQPTRGVGKPGGEVSDAGGRPGSAGKLKRRLRHLAWMVELNETVLEASHPPPSAGPAQSQPVAPPPGPDRPRDTWGGKYEFLLSCLGYCVGLGNVWRFPYLCYRNGGGVFLIPYGLMLLFTGLPLFLMELSLGQYGAAGPITVWKCCPLLKGIGIGMLVVSSLVTLYYNVILAWTFYYLGMSLQSPLPWSCQAPPNAPLCQAQNVSLGNASRSSASEAFWNEQVLGVVRSSGLGDPGAVRWPLALCLLLAWLVVFLCTLRGIRSSGKVVYFTATFPYLVIVVLIIRGATLEGSIDGVRFYLSADWSRLHSAQGHPGDRPGELRHQLLCRLCHLLHPGPHGLAEEGARGGSGRDRSWAGVCRLPRSPCSAARLSLLVRALLPDALHPGNRHAVWQHGGHRDGRDGRVPLPAGLQAEGPLPGGAVPCLLLPGPPAGDRGGHLLVHPPGRLQHQLRPHRHRPLHVPRHGLLLRSEPVLPRHRGHDPPVPALVQQAAPLLQGLLGGRHARAAAVHPLLHLPGSLEHQAALWPLPVSALGGGPGGLPGSRDLRPDPAVGRGRALQGVRDAGR
ncbi:uncharacterized protein LOC143839284 isoform X7 [Paroedura picta]|uniref:uncharacterized protein LOC143839284 isoform X7 n=1 Tax=Paroedura picta TaxID=143630 RepID=UPI00405713FF